MNIISKISLRKALRFFLLLAVAFTALKCSNVRADEKENKSKEKSEKEKKENTNNNNSSEEKKEGWSTPWVVGIAALCVVIAIGGSYFAFGRSKEEEV